MHVARVHAQPPQRHGAQFVGCVFGRVLDDTVSGLDVVKQKVAVRVDDLIAQRVRYGKRSAIDNCSRGSGNDGADMTTGAANILGCADGPASFNAEASRLGHSVISIDPLYRFDAGTIRDRIAVTYHKMLEQARRNSQQFVWDTIQSVQELGFIRMRAMQAFLDDYDLGKRQGRYIDAELPSIALPDKSFDLAVCSHFLFLYTEQVLRTISANLMRFRLKRCHMNFSGVGTR